ncbi:MAG: D-mannonate epimerase, partial [Ignavibacteria bacterium]
IMGRIDTPVRKILNYASDNFANDLPIIYVLTVIDKASENSVKVKGLFIGDDYETFKHAAELSIKLNFQLLDKPLDKVVVYLDPSEFKSTWLGNKSIYRTRMALADDGELIILAPGVKSFGEDPQIDRLIRKYGYKSTNEILKSVEENDDLKMNLSAAAHLIHGSSEGRFKITYSTVELSKEEIESVNYNYEDYNKIKSIYDPTKLNDGFNQLPNGEEIFYISNPALGLWANKEIFNKSGVK